ncbi:MAG: hypothetical protein BWZ08_01983 [candidate division BRC1 bacterium ADurb.BinA292]|nr:MAG: hypothetical protein BWZ08_01983 [candidate division BRC1 bacterium ADurb.BinA292]
MKPTDVRLIGAELYYLPLKLRVPLKFGAETLTHLTCARARVTIRDRAGKTARGWGETPLSVAWVWPGQDPFADREEQLMRLCERIARAWSGFEAEGHPIEIGHDFQEQTLPGLLRQANDERPGHLTAIPWLAALVACSPFDIALHDAYGNLLGRPVYDTYTAEFMNRDLAGYLEPIEDGDVSFAGRYPADFLEAEPPAALPVWHLVGGLDPVDRAALTGNEPDDGEPVLLEDWIRRDGLKCLKIKLRGNDAAWDYNRIVEVGTLAARLDAHWLSPDFNCTVKSPEYVNQILDRLLREQPRIYGMLLYVEQPFPYELESHPINVHSVSARKPLFMDESAHDWKLVRLGHALGWTGVALKTCKTQTGALLTLCWAKAHGMTLMVQDLTNPMLAQIPHVLLAAHAGTIMGVECNAMQFYPRESDLEARVHPGLYQRRNGRLDLTSIRGSGFGYRVDEVGRELPPAVVEHAP